jgi:hypothetical protein
MRFGMRLHLRAFTFTGMLNFDIGLSVKAVVTFQYKLSFNFLIYLLSFWINRPSTGIHLRRINGRPLYYKHSIAKRTPQCNLGNIV